MEGSERGCSFIGRLHKFDIRLWLSCTRCKPAGGWKGPTMLLESVIWCDDCGQSYQIDWLDERQ